MIYKPVGQATAKPYQVDLAHISRRNVFILQAYTESASARNATLHQLYDRGMTAACPVQLRQDTPQYMLQ